MISPQGTTPRLPYERWQTLASSPSGTKHYTILSCPRRLSSVDRGKTSGSSPAVPDTRRSTEQMRRKCLGCRTPDPRRLVGVTLSFHSGLFNYEGWTTSPGRHIRTNNDGVGGTGSHGGKRRGEGHRRSGLRRRRGHSHSDYLRCVRGSHP